MGIGFRRFVRRPILASVVVGMVVGLLAHA